MYDKTGKKHGKMYDKMSKKYGKEMPYRTEMYQDQHNPNEGDNYKHYTSAGSSKGGLSAGVGDGLSYAMSISVIDAEGVRQNQRVEGYRESVGKGMVIGY